MAFQHFRQFGEFFSKLAKRSGVFIQAYLNKRCEGKAQFAGVQARAVAVDKTRLLQRAQAAQAR